jgi:hypothetical protein
MEGGTGLIKCKILSVCILAIIFVCSATPAIMERNAPLPDKNNEETLATGLKEPTAAQENWMK